MGGDSFRACFAGWGNGAYFEACGVKSGARRPRADQGVRPALLEWSPGGLIGGRHTEAEGKPLERRLHWQRDVCDSQAEAEERQAEAEPSERHGPRGAQVIQ